MILKDKKNKKLSKNSHKWIFKKVIIKKMLNKRLVNQWNNKRMLNLLFRIEI